MSCSRTIQLKHTRRPVKGAVDIRRTAYTTPQLYHSFGLKEKHKPSVKEKLEQCSKSCRCSRDCFIERLLLLFPFVNLVRHYKWKKFIVSDIVAGLSVGVIHIPQGMGFALLTNVPPVYGLYSSFFPGLVYFFFGTSNHLSMGTMPLMSILAGVVVQREATRMMAEFPNGTLCTNSTADFFFDDRDQAFVELKVGVAVSLTLMIGMFQLAMALLRLGVVATFMSQSFVSSFLTGATLVIILGQIHPLMGLTFQQPQGTFRIPLLVYEMCCHIQTVNVASLITGIKCVMVLIVTKEVINIKFRARMKMPIPAELIVVVIGTIVSHFAGLETNYSVKVVGVIEKEIPPPRPPPLCVLKDFQHYIVDGFVLAVVSFTIAITMAKRMAHKHGYKIDPNQEMLAYGIMHGTCSFFGCFALSQGLPRTLVNDAVGCKTQMHTLVASLLVLLVLLALGPLFYSLPITVLSAVIICALLPLFRHFKELPNMWRVSKYDFFVWVITFSSVVIFSIVIGLVVGIGASLLMVILQIHLSKASLLEGVGDTGLYVSNSYRKSQQNGPSLQEFGIAVYKFESPLYFVNVERFKQQLFQLTVDPRECTKKEVYTSVLAVEDCEEDGQPELRVRHARSISKRKTYQPDHMLIEVNSIDAPDDVMTDENGTSESSHNPSCTISTADSVSVHIVNKPSIADCDVTARPEIHSIILDCSALSYVDLIGVNSLSGLRDAYEGVGIRLSLADCPSSLEKKLQAAGTLENFVSYPSIHDAVVDIMCDKPSCC